MMRSFENRSDSRVCDEPLYAHYLKVTGLDHPLREEIIEQHESDWRKVVEELLSEPRQGERVYYQKHMAHHLLPDIDRDWMRQLENCFLIRDPAEMLTSLMLKLPSIRLEDTGLPQQVEVMRMVEETRGQTPVILDSRDVLEDPRGMLSALCERVEIPFEDAMLSWQPGPRDSDGIWAKHWYQAVEKSTGFQTYRPKDEEVPPELEPILAECIRYYDELYSRRLKPGS
ncbi:MAG: sulfotransferase-like domain-containing protein, partial [Planctomycetota bacterium]|jgi:hypothetical protein